MSPAAAGAFVSGPRSSRARSSGSADRHPRPTWLLPRPLPLRGHVARLVSGPERIETGWWDGYDVRRDYYLVQTSFGQRAWAFRPAGDAPVGGRGEGFMLHGWFG